MLSGEDNENGEKTTIGVISKKAITCSTLFLYISLPLFCTTTTWNFQKLLSYTVFRGNVVRVLDHLFFTAAHFHHALVSASISHVVTAATKFSRCSSNNKASVSFVFFFLSLALDLCHLFSLWASLACCLLSLFFFFLLFFSCSIFRICRHDN